MKYDLEPGKYPEKKLSNDNDTYVGNGWSVKRNKNKYFLEYISGAMQGELKIIEISKEDFFLAKKGKINLNDFLIKYGVY